MGIALSLGEINTMYMHFFSKPKPQFMGYTEAMQELVEKIGPDKITERKKEVELEGESNGTRH